MNKSTQLLLSDYLSDKVDIRLSLFCNSISPDFKLNKANKAQLDLLISDYQKDHSKQRLKVLESFIGGTKQSPKSGKKEEVKINKLSSLLDAPKDKQIIELLDLQNKFMETKAEYRRNPLPFLKDRLDDLQLRIYEIEEARGFYGKDPQAQEKTELSLIKNTIGDWNTDGTVAYIMLNGGQGQFSLTSFWHPTYLMEILTKNTGRKCRDYIISNNLGAANYKSAKKGTFWTLTDKSSGYLPPKDPKDLIETVSMK